MTLNGASEAHFKEDSILVFTSSSLVALKISHSFLINSIYEQISGLCWNFMCCTFCEIFSSAT